jgi:hypothetical protein
LENRPIVRPCGTCRRWCNGVGIAAETAYPLGDLVHILPQDGRPGVVDFDRPLDPPEDRELVSLSGEQLARRPDWDTEFERSNNVARLAGDLMEHGAVVISAAHSVG